MTDTKYGSAQTQLLLFPHILYVNLEMETEKYTEDESQIQHAKNKPQR